MHAPNSNTASKGLRAWWTSPARSGLLSSSRLGVPPPPRLGTRAYCQWHRLGRPWPGHALLRRERLEDVWVDPGVSGRGGGTVGVRLLGAEHRLLRSRSNLGLRRSHRPRGEHLRLAQPNSSIGSPHRPLPPAALDDKQRTFDKHVFGQPEYEHDHRREPASARTAPQATTRSATSSNQNANPVTPASLNGRRTRAVV